MKIKGLFSGNLNAFMLLSLFSVLYLTAVLLSGVPFCSTVFLLLAAGLIYLHEYRKTGNVLTLPGTLALGLIGGEGIARLQLSRLSYPWTIDTWISFYLFFIVFYGIYRWTLLIDPAFGRVSVRISVSEGEKRLKRMILFLLVLVYACFFLEAWRLGFIPFFTVDTPHAYSTFHLKGVHYFTTLVILIPALTAVYLKVRNDNGKGPDPAAIAAIFLSILLTILMVSRFQMMMALLLFVFTALLTGKRYKVSQLFLMLVLLIGLYVMITVARAHSVEYLNGIFEMKNANTPIFITQPYMYIANNYENFNLMTIQLEEHSLGLRSLYPVFTLSGLKFLIPALNGGFPLFVTKEELTTVTMLYDAWYDLGLFGIVLFGCMLGVFAAFVQRLYEHMDVPLAAVLYGQIAFYFAVSFFTTWFSNPAVWFYLGVSVCLYILYPLCFIDKNRA